MTDPDNTSAETLMRAAEIGRKSGLRYIYVGNLPGEVGDLENTRCPNCQQLLIERYGYLITGYFLTREGSCRSCGTVIPGHWAPEFQGQITAYPYVPHRSMGSGLVSILNFPA
jgi:pyruvate formate lyase activating enzyme